METKIEEYAETMKKKVDDGLKRKFTDKGKPIPKTEFGRGLIINLVKFAEHFENRMANQISHAKLYMSKTKEEQELMLSDNPPPNLNYGRFPKEHMKGFLNIYVKVHGTSEKALSSLIELWANGASDHLYEILVPRRWKGTELEKKVKKLQHLGLEIGHGFTGKIWKFDDFVKLQDLTKEIAILIDSSIGLNKQVDLGKF